MFLRDSLDLVSREKRKNETVKAAQKSAVGMGFVAAVGMGVVAAVGVSLIVAAGVATGILFAPKSGKETREDLKKKAVNTVETIKDKVSAHSAQEVVCNVIQNVHGKTEGVKKDIKDGFHEITQDIHKTAENISNELNHQNNAGNS